MRLPLGAWSICTYAEHMCICTSYVHIYIHVPIHIYIHADARTHTWHERQATGVGTCDAFEVQRPVCVDKEACGCRQRAVCVTGWENCVGDCWCLDRHSATHCNTLQHTATGYEICVWDCWFVYRQTWCVDRHTWCVDMMWEMWCERCDVRDV